MCDRGGIERVFVVETDLSRTWLIFWEPLKLLYKSITFIRMFWLNSEAGSRGPMLEKQPKSPWDSSSQRKLARKSPQNQRFSAAGAKSRFLKSSYTMTKVSVFKDQSNEETSRCLFCISASKKTMRIRDIIMETLENIVFARFRVRYGQKMNCYIGFTSSSRRSEATADVNWLWLRVDTLRSLSGYCICSATPSCHTTNPVPCTSS